MAVALPSASVNLIRARKGICERAHKCLYQMGLLWAILGACLHNLTQKHSLNIHPFLQWKEPRKTSPLPCPVPPADKEVVWKSIANVPRANATLSPLATPIKEVIGFSDSDPSKGASVPEPEDLASHRLRILSTHTSLGQQAQKERGPPSKYHHVRTAPLKDIKPEDLPDLANYAASARGMIDFHSGQLEKNLAEFLASLPQVQLVIYSSIQEVEQDLIPEPLWSYYREYCSIMEDPQFRADSKDIPQIGLPPLAAWSDPDSVPSPLKNAQGLPFPRILALATINTLRDGEQEIYLEENTVSRYEFYGLCVLFWEVFSLHSKHWGWARGDYFRYTTALQ